MRKLLLLLLVGILMLEGCTGLVNSDFTVQVTGTSGLKFIGDYMTATTSGGSTSKSVEGTVPATYTVSGSIVSVVFQKQSEGGLLKVAILKGGKVVSQSETTATYGVVSVATQ